MPREPGWSSTRSSREISPGPKRKLLPSHRISGANIGRGSAERQVSAGTRRSSTVVTSALRVLRRLPGLLQAVLPTFLLAGVACEVTLGLELRSKFWIQLDQSSGDAEL